jgi:phage terminase small subunit
MKPKLQKVCNLVLKGKSMREALLACGYSDSYASHNSHKFLHNREVQRYIRERQKQIEDACLADDIFLISDLKAIIKDTQATPVEKIEARKLLEKINARFEEIKMRGKELEKEVTPQANVTIKIETATKEDVNGN